MLGRKLTQSERILKGIVRLQQDKPFFAGIVMYFKTNATRPDSEIPMAGVNRYGDFYWNENWISSITDPEIQFTLCHEALHLAKGDFFRQGKREAVIWNIASDCIINWYLVQENMSLPKDIIIPTHDGRVTIGKKEYQIAGKTTEQVYDMLIQDIEIIKISLPGVGNAGGLGHGGIDIHLPGDTNDVGQSTGQETGSAAVKQAEQAWKSRTITAATVAKARGSMPGCAEEFIDAILNPKVDWRNRMKQFVTDEIPVDFCNRIPGRKFYATGIWCPRVKRENIEVFISIDGSGSTQPWRQMFLSEAVGILTAYTQVKARLIVWDTRVNPNNDVELTTDTIDQLMRMKLKDISGGTELSSYTNYLDEKGYTSRFHIVLTDGIIETNPKVPNGSLLFVLTPDGSDEIIKHYGEVCRVSDVDPNYGH